MTANRQQYIVQPRLASELFSDWRNESLSAAAITMLDGRPCDKHKPQKVRNYSWVMTKEWIRAATKSHISELRYMCLHPLFPIAICIRDGLGKTQQLDKTPVCNDWPLRVNFEGMIAVFDQAQLIRRLDLCRVIAKVFGKGESTAKMVFSDPSPVSWGWQFSNDFLREWVAVRNEPLTRLAWFLCENKQELNQ